MPDESKPHQFRVELDIDLDRHLMGRPIYDDEGEIVDAGPTTLEQIIVGAVVNDVVRRIVSDGYKDLRRHVLDIRDEVIREHVEPMVVEAIERSVQPTNHYGEPTGEPVTLREVVLTTAEKALTKDISGYNQPHQTMVQKAINDAVNRTLEREFAAALDEGKAEIKAALQAEGAKMMAEAIAKTVAA